MPTFDRAEINPITMVVWSMGNWLVRTLPYSAQPVKICDGCSRLYYKIGRKGTPCYNYVEQCPKIHMEIHHIQVTWDFILISFKLNTNTSSTRFSLPSTHIRQWKTIQQLEFHGILLKFGNKTAIHISWTPPEQWIGWTSKPNPIGQFKKVAQWGERPLDRRTTERLMVLSDNPPNGDMRNTIQTHIRMQGNDTRWSGTTIQLTRTL